MIAALPSWLSGFGTRAWVPHPSAPTIAPLPLLPKFAHEERLHPSRGEAGVIAHPRRARKILLRTRYLRHPNDLEPHRLVIDEDGCLRRALGGETFSTIGMYPGLRSWDQRHEDRAIYTLAQGGALYAADVTALSVGVPDYLAALHGAPAGHVPDVLEICHHSTFAAGDPVLCAGELATDEDGRLVSVSNYSGHYRPLRAHLVAFLASLAADGVRLDEVTVELVHPDGTASIYESAAALDHRP